MISVEDVQHSYSIELVSPVATKDKCKMRLAACNFLNSVFLLLTTREKTLRWESAIEFYHYPLLDHVSCISCQSVNFPQENKERDRDADVKWKPLQTAEHYKEDMLIIDRIST